MEVKQFGKYSLLDYMGKGGMASVYRASDTEDGSIVAVKIFESSEERPPDMSRKLRDREVRMLVSVQHPNIVKFHQAGQLEEDYFYAMEFVENSLLKCMRSGNDFDLLDKVLILRQTTSALAAIHHQGVVHRDVKPGNILLDQDPTGAIHVKVTDLGIAKNVSETDIVREQMPTRVPGTAKYLSPEQALLQAVDGRADIFGLGVVAYELLTGIPPFKADTADGYLAANRQQKQAPAHQISEDVPSYLGEMIEKMLTKDREERYDSDTLLRDLELVQQHLVSSAPMVDQLNPASLFYEAPPVSERKEPEVKPEALIAPVAWALALAIALIGVILSVALWPGGVPEPASSPAPADPSPPSALDLVQEAAAAADAERYWQALALVRTLQDEELPSDQSRRLEVLSARAQAALAQGSYAAAQTMLSEGRRPEAEIVLLRMQEFMPEARSTRDLAEAMRRELSSLDQHWDEALRDTYALVRRRRYKEALEARKKLLAEFSADAEKADLARRTIGDLFDHWGRYLLQSYPEPEAVKDFFRTLNGHRDIVPDGSVGRLVGELHVKLAQTYREQGDYELALSQYELAAEAAEGAVARQARRDREELLKWLTDRPHEAAALARELELSGFQGALWQEHTDSGGSQRVAGGVLQLSAQGGRDGATVQRETVRPVRNLGFSAGVQFRASAALLRQPGSARVGVAVSGIKGSLFELAFDGESYLITRKSGQVSAGGIVGKAFGDEDSAWHALALSYNFNTGQLAVLVDGQELHSYPLDLSDFRLRVSLLATPGSAAEAEFKDVFCRP